MKHQPERTCIGCKKVLHKDDVVRIVAGHESIVVDYRDKLSGRAAYVCPKTECIKKALTKEALGRSLRLKICLPETEVFIAQLKASIEERIKSLLSISLKAGKLAVGYSAVQDAIEKGRVELVLYAHDLSEGTKGKIAIPGTMPVRKAVLFTRDIYGSILNRESVGVVAILDKGLANALWNETLILKGLINVDD
jgi:predicted RNA-binding protein YlxR (DUF448 family)